MDHPDPANALIADLGRAAAEIFSGTRIFLAYAYGSRVRGTARPSSDLDVAYHLRGYREGERLAIKEEMLLEDRLSRRLGIEVDLRNTATAPPDVRGRVLEEGIRIYCADERARVELEADLLGRYHDYKEKYRRLCEERLESFAERGVKP